MLSDLLNNSPFALTVTRQAASVRFRTTYNGLRHACQSSSQKVSCERLFDFNGLVAFTSTRDAKCSDLYRHMGSMVDGIGIDVSLILKRERNICADLTLHDSSIIKDVQNLLSGRR